MPKRPQAHEPDDPAQNCTSATTLPEKQEAVALALACGKTVAAASREHKVGASTIWGWKKHDLGFASRVSELRNQLTDAAIGRLADMMSTHAADALKALLAAESEAVRLDAVKAVYELFINVRNSNDLKERIEELEAKLTTGGNA